MGKSQEAPTEEPRTPEENFIAQIGGLGKERAGHILEALRKMSSSKRPGELFTISDAFTEWSKAGSGPSDVEDTLNSWVITGKMYGGNVEGISEMRVSEAIELLAQKYESKEQQ